MRIICSFGPGKVTDDKAIADLQKSLADAVREQQHAGKLSNLRDRWEAAYFTVFTEDLPSEIVFTGSSGD